MKKNINQDYVSPAVEIYESVSEGILCASEGGIGAGIEDWEDSDEDYGGVVGF